MTIAAFERLLCRREAAAFLCDRGYRVAVATLNKWATIGGGPKFRKFGRRPLYAPSDLLAWAEERTTAPVRSTSEADRITRAAGAARIRATPP